MTAAATATPTLITSDKVILGGGALLTVLAGVADYGGWTSVLAFVISGAAVCLLASVVGRSVEQLGDRSARGDGVLQSALGNLPELFICIFALKAGLVDVVRAALVGSILANLLLVLGIAFVVGGLRHGTQQLGSERARDHRRADAAVGLGDGDPVARALAAHTGRGSRDDVLGDRLGPAAGAVRVVAALLAPSLGVRRRRHATRTRRPSRRAGRCGWRSACSPRPVLAAAFVSDWFVNALTPAMDALSVNETFAGLVVVAIAGNAIENVVGVQLAAGASRRTRSR